MSVHAYAWAWQQDAGQTEKLVLLAMCDFADHTGVCWPSHATLARMCGLHRATVFRAIERLIELGYVMRAKGRGKSNTYRIMLAAPKLPPESRSSATWDEAAPAKNRRAFPAGPVAQSDTFELFDLSTPVAQSDTSPVAESDTPPNGPVAQRDTTCRSSATPPVAQLRDTNRKEPLRNRQTVGESVDNSDPDAWHRIPDESRALAAQRIAELRASMALRTGVSAVVELTGAHDASPSATHALEVEGEGIS